MCNGDDLILNPLFNFKAVKVLEHWGDVTMFRSLNMLKALNLNDG